MPRRARNWSTWCTSTRSEFSAGGNPERRASRRDQKRAARDPLPVIPGERCAKHRAREGDPGGGDRYGGSRLGSLPSCSLSLAFAGNDNRSAIILELRMSSYYCAGVKTGPYAMAAFRFALLAILAAPCLALAQSAAAPTESITVTS